MRIHTILNLSLLIVAVGFFQTAEGAQVHPKPDTVVQAVLVAPPNVPPPPTWNQPALVKVALEVTQRKGRLADGVEFEFWTFGGTVPAPMIRVREGDTVELQLTNAKDSQFTHSIDLHAVTGPGGGARNTQVGPGQEAIFRFQALRPGVYVYHCATSMIPMHVSHGLYGLIVVEPAGGFPRVDREFYVMQGDIYTEGTFGEKGLQESSVEKLLQEAPEYVVFNGAADSLTGERALKARVGETVRIFFGVGGPNLVSSFHAIGEIFDVVYPEGATEPTKRNVQTTLVPAGGATIVQFKLEVPGNYILVDHSLSRIHKGAVGILAVEGAENPSVYEVVKDPKGAPSGH